MPYGQPSYTAPVYTPQPPAYNAKPYESAPYNAKPYESAPYNAKPYESAPYNAKPYESAPVYGQPPVYPQNPSPYMPYR